MRNHVASSNHVAINLQPSASDFSLSFNVLAVLILLRLLVPKFVLQPFLTGRVNPPDQMQNACDHCMKLLFHFILLIWGLYVIPQESWMTSVWTPTKGIWADFPPTVISRPLYFYYQAQFAFYVSATIFHFFEPKRKDYWIMIFHHICTAGLIAFSYLACFCRIGSIVLLTREFSDVLLHLTKVVVFLGHSGLGMASFASLMISWVPLRLIMFPYSILYSTLLDSRSIGPVQLANHHYDYVFFNIALGSLVPLDWYYFIVGLQIAYRRATTGTLKDTRD